jgi:predicted enzyme related to lactoylglutathione lyase
MASPESFPGSSTDGRRRRHIAPKRGHFAGMANAKSLPAGYARATPRLQRQERWISDSTRISTDVTHSRRETCRLVHLELHTGDEVQASAFYGELLGWSPERVWVASSSYLALDLGTAIGGGVVECGITRPLWLPYVEVVSVDEATDHACRLGATVKLDPSEGRSGWRSVVSNPAAGEVALWQPKR